MEPLRIAFCGDSSGLRVRPKGTGLPYPALVEHKFKKTNIPVIVKNEHKGGALIQEEILHNDRVIRFYPDYIVFSYSVEKYPRVLARSFHRWIYVKTRITYTNGNLALDKFSKLFRKGVKKISPPVTKLFGLKGWCSPKAYENLLYDYISRMQEETQVKRCIIFSSLYVTNWAEKQLPGARKNTPIYDECIRNVANRTNSLVVNTNQILEKAARKLYNKNLPACEELLMPDGYHFSSHVHKMIADEITQMILNDLEMRSDFTFIVIMKIRGPFFGFALFKLQSKIIRQFLTFPSPLLNRLRAVCTHDPKIE